MSFLNISPLLATFLKLKPFQASVKLHKLSKSHSKIAISISNAANLHK
jgi:hypothetical protein